jgi:drug/metabolite transporter (DMT)-like permease
MARGYVPLLLLVAGIWGASFMFIEIAGDEIEPGTMMAVRLLLAGLTLLPLLLLQQGPAATVADMRAAGGGLLVLGVVNAAVPFTLIAWGQTHIDSGTAAIANAPVPIFVALLALKFRASERVNGLRLVGILMGFVGIAVLVGFSPESGWWPIVGTLAVVAAAFCYASANLFAQARLSDVQPLVIVAGSSFAGALFLSPLALWQAPDEVPGWGAMAALAALGIGGTAIALVFYYRMLASYGASRASLVTYLIPPTALVYGVVFLDEALTANAIAGLLLILGGVALGSGVFRFSRRREVVPATPHA